MVTKTHVGSVALGQTGAVYTITVINADSGPSSGTVTVTDALPGGLTATGMGGTGWTCTLATLACTRSDALSTGSSYPLTVTVSVTGTPSGSVTNQVSVMGGGSAAASASDLTNILTFSPCDINQDKATNVSDVQLMINGALGMGGAARDLNGDGLINVVDVQIVINAILGQGCWASS
jgi:uncharacterized repeat protein (TIGR01451 family)